MTDARRQQTRQTQPGDLLFGRDGFRRDFIEGMAVAVLGDDVLRFNPGYTQKLSWLKGYLWHERQGWCCPRKCWRDNGSCYTTWLKNPYRFQ